MEDIDFRMFEATARRALRAQIASEGHKIGKSDLDEEALSLAYTFAEAARTRAEDVIAERCLPGRVVA